MKCVHWKDCKAIAADPKLIYQAATEDEALLALDQFAEKLGAKYPPDLPLMEGSLGEFKHIFSYPADIRKAIYTANAIES
ncbi:MAG: transposase [Arenicella sp.]|nr:transposase [Arenicella sp.]